MSLNPNVSVTKKERDCIVSIGRGSGDGFPVRVTALAESLGVKPPTAEELLRRLEGKGLVARRRGMIILSERGRELYRRIMMSHRVMETFLVQCGMDADRACRMISEFDYLIDEEASSLVLSRIGNPTRCPHGNPIVVS
jgi:DtxR family Mn-dependent transcriptional regulator